MYLKFIKFKVVIIRLRALTMWVLAFVVNDQKID